MKPNFVKRWRIVMMASLTIMLSLVLCGNTNAQNRLVTGKITNAKDGQPLPGASIQVKGSSHGTISDQEGNYTLQIEDGQETLVVTFVGMKTLEMNIDDRLIINVALKEDIVQLSEIVITALGEERDRDKVGSSSVHIGGKSVAESGEPTLINGLSGKSSSLIISRSSGDPGAGSYIQIRGQSSISGSVQPLIIVDGAPIYNSNIGSYSGGVVQQSRLNDLNPNDIESIEVLKGASASALWGTRAGNGVIVIKTKKGNGISNKLSISYSNTYSIDEILARHPLQNKWGQGIGGYYFTNSLSSSPGFPYSFGDKISNRSGLPDDVIDNPNDPDHIGYFLTPDGQKIYPVRQSGFQLPANGGKNSTATYDPYKTLFDGGHSLDQNISISGSNNGGSYYFSIANLNQKGIAKANSDYRKTSVRLNTEQQFTDWIKLSNTIFYSRITSNRLQMGNNLNSIFLGGLRTSPDWNNDLGYEGSYVAADGTQFSNRQLSYRNQVGRSANPGYDNPLWTMYNIKNNNDVNRFIGTAQLDVQPLEWLTATMRGSIDHYSEGRSEIDPVGSAGVYTGHYSLQSIRETQLNFDGFLQGNFRVSSQSKLSSLIGFNAQERTFNNLQGVINNFIIASNPPLSLTNATTENSSPFNQFVQQRGAAIYATLDYDHRDQLFLSLTGRAENSSVFSHKDNPTFFYPSITANWHFLKSLGIKNAILSFAKLRAGYGIVSTIPEPYKLTTYYYPSIYSDGWSSPLYANGSLYEGGYEQSAEQGNSALKPETKREFEFGLDLRMFNDRINLNATYYTNIISDLIIPVAVAGSTGFSSKILNAASIQNEGLELDFEATVFSKKRTSIQFYGNWTQFNNRVTDLGGKDVITIFGPGYEQSIVRGYSMGVIYGIGFERTEEGEMVLENGFPKAATGKTVLGDANPDWRAGLGSKFAWNNLTLNVLFEHSHGGDIWGGTRGALINFGTHADTNHEVTIAAADVGLYKNYAGYDVATYDYPVSADGSYTVRGYLHDFGAGPVLIDETWWTDLGGGFGPQMETFIEEAEWTKLREISLSYSFNSASFKKKTKLSSLDFSIAGRNLFLWTQFKGNDPETNLTGPSNFRNRDYFNNPATKSVLFTVRINY